MSRSLDIFWLKQEISKQLQEVIQHELDTDTEREHLELLRTRLREMEGTEE